MIGEFSHTLIMEKKASDLIQENSKVKKATVARDLQYIDVETKKQRDTSNWDVPDMSVRERMILNVFIDLFVC